MRLFLLLPVIAASVAHGDEQPSELIKTQVTDINTNRQQILADHNYYRAKHNAQPLHLDQGLISSAQSYADTLAWNDAGIPHSVGGNYGESLFRTYSDPATSATQFWYDENTLYNYATGGFSLATGHFTALVWRATTSLGVGIATSASGYTYVVAHYFPPGNYAGEFAENVHPPQSNPNLAEQMAGNRYVKTLAGGYMRAHAPNNVWTVDLAPSGRSHEQWTVSAVNGKVTLKSYLGKYLNSRSDGIVGLVDVPQAHEMWTPVKNNDGSWSLQGFHGTWLSFYNPPLVYLMPSNQAMEHFHLESLTDLAEQMAGNRYLKTLAGGYIRAHAPNNVWTVDLAPSGRSHEQWTISAVNGKVTLKSYLGKYLNSRSDGIVGLVDIPQAHEMWTPVKNNDGSWSLQGFHGTWLSFYNPPLVYLMPSNQAMEHFHLESLTELAEQMAGNRYLKTLAGSYMRVENVWTVDLAPNALAHERWIISAVNGKVTLKSHDGKYLSYRSDGKATVANSPLDNEMWTPFKNNDGTWSLQSNQGTWLSFYNPPLVYLMPYHQAMEHFFLESGTA